MLLGKVLDDRDLRRRAKPGARDEFACTVQFFGPFLEDEFVQFAELLQEAAVGNYFASLAHFAHCLLRRQAALHDEIGEHESGGPADSHSTMHVHFAWETKKNSFW